MAEQYWHPLKAILFINNNIFAKKVLSILNESQSVKLLRYRKFLIWLKQRRKLIAANGNKADDALNM